MCSTQRLPFAFKLCFLNLFILLTAGCGVYRQLDVDELSESSSLDDQQAQPSEFGNVGTDTAESELRRIELFKKSLLKQLNLESSPNVTQSERPALSSPVITAFLKQHKIDLERLQNKENHIEDEMTSQTLLITAKQPPFTTVTSFQNWFYFEFSSKERMNFRVKSANIWFYVQNTSSFIASTTVKLDVMQPRFNQTSDEMVYIPVSHSSEIINSTERKNSETWKYISITSLAENWLRDPTTNFGVKLYTIDVMNVIASGLLPEEEEYTPFMEVELVADHRRRKRNVGNQQNCERQNGTINECCVQDLKVNFDELGWDWIIFPVSYNASYCAGVCTTGPLPSIHSTIVQAVSERLQIRQPNQHRRCCVPIQYAALSLLFFDEQQNIIYREVPNMIVRKCGCL